MLNTDRHLKLEDVTKPFKLPAVLDLKMGLKVWGDDKPMSKVQRERKKFPFQEVIGFRVVGMKVCCLSSYLFFLVNTNSVLKGTRDQRL